MNWKEKDFVDWMTVIYRGARNGKVWAIKDYELIKDLIIASFDARQKALRKRAGRGTGQ